jgi:signal transduction histidine kinase
LNRYKLVSYHDALAEVRGIYDETMKALRRPFALSIRIDNEVMGVKKNVMNAANELVQEISLRIKYESFAKLTTELSAALTLDEVTTVLQANLKYLFDFNHYRILFFYESEELLFEIGRCHAEYRKQIERVYGAEASVIAHDMTKVYSTFEIAESAIEIPLSFFKKQAGHVCFYPVKTSAQQHLLIGASSESDKAPTDVDYRFLRLTGDFLSGKLAQLVLKSQLEHIVKKRTEQLNLANHEMSTLFYRASHDFSAPLTTLLGLVHLCRIEVDDPHELNMLFNRIDSVIGQAQCMLYKLKMISETEALAHGIGKINLDEFLQKLVNKRAQQARASNIYINYNILGHRQIVFNEAILATLIDNLVENSIAYHRCSNGSFISIRIEVSDSLVRVTVEDNGQGIPAERLASIFKMYSRCNEDSKGNGLGLYLVKKITEKLNGSVNAESLVGKGTRVELAIPL